ncbi:MAG TPA: hypothetical protein ENK25_11490 [Bacteroidetes bacterium]|nr:hypothetical protein [Bacteroidota bacterium]
MNSRDRFFKAIHHENPDRPPIFVTLTPQAAKKLSDHLNLPYEKPYDSLLASRISHVNLLTTLGNDCVGIAACYPDNYPTQTLDNGILENEWHMKFIDQGIYFEFYEYPLAHAVTKADIEKFDFPDPYARGRFDIARKNFEKYKNDYAIVAELETTIFETSWYLVGLEKLLTDMMTGAEYVEPLLDRIMEVNLAIGKELISIGADMVWAGDDFGSQNGMLISPDLWRQYFKPRMKYMFDEFRKANPDIIIAWHTCGSVLPIIPELIEIGLDVLNPIQPLAYGMNGEYLKKTYGDKLVLFGGFDIQHLMPAGSPEEIRAEVRRLKSVLGKDGGYIIAPAHNIQDDTSVENILAFFDEAKKPV